MRLHSILVVDTDPAVVRTCRDALAGLDCGVLGAKTTTEALEMLGDRSSDIGLVISEIEPRVDFFRLLGAIKTSCPVLPVVVWTALGDWDSYAKAMGCGATEFLTKPVLPIELHALLGRLEYPEHRRCALTAP